MSGGYRGAQSVEQNPVLVYQKVLQANTAMVCGTATPDGVPRIKVAEDVLDEGCESRKLGVELAAGLRCGRNIYRSDAKSMCTACNLYGDSFNEVEGG
jgi:hypothetical protein